MDRCALFVDAGYVLSDGADAVHGTRRSDSVRWDHPGLLKLFADLARDRTGLPVLRCYWYEANADAVPGAEHEALADIPGLKLRLRRAGPGRREGIEADLKRDLLTLARNHAISDALIVTGDENITELVAETQDHGIRIIVAHITAAGRWSVPSALRQECDDLAEVPAEQLRPFTELTGDAGPAAAAVPPAGRAGNQAAAAGVSPGSGMQAAVPAQVALDSRPAAQFDPGGQTGGYLDPAGQAARQFDSGMQATGHFDPAGQAARQFGSGVHATGQLDLAGHAVRHSDSDPHTSGHFDPASHAVRHSDSGPHTSGSSDPGVYAAEHYTPGGEARLQGDSATYASGRLSSGGYADGVPGPAGQNGWDDHHSQAPGQFDGAVRWAGQQDAGAHAAGPRTDYGFGGPGSSPVPAQQNGNGQPADLGQRNGWPHDSGASAGPSGNGSSQHPSAGYAQFAESTAGVGQPPPAGYRRQGGDLSEFDSRNGNGQGGPVPAPHADGRAGLSSGMPAPQADGRAGLSSGMPAPQADVGAGLSSGMPGPQADVGAGQYSSMPATDAALPAQAATGYSQPNSGGPADRYQGLLPGVQGGTSRAAGPDPARPVYSTDQWYADSSPTSLPRQAGRDSLPPAPLARASRSELPDQPIRAGQADLSGRADYGMTADQVTRANKVMRSDQPAMANQASRSGYIAHDPLASGSNGETRAAALAAPVYYQQQPAAGILQAAQPAIPAGRFDPTATPLHAATQAQLASAGHLVGASRNGGSLPAAGLQAATPASLTVGQGTSAPVSPSEAGRVARGEGYSFGETVARDAPALWLDAVLARKPRMPSDLEARLLQGSALPIDSLLNDDVRQALRQGFWDALETSRR